MARIAGIDLPRNKRIEVALTYIYGIGRSSSQKILAKAGVDFNTRSDDLTESEAGKIPELKRVVVAYQNQVVMQETLEGGLNEMFGGTTQGAAAPTGTGAATPTAVDAVANIQAMISAARQRYDNAMQAQREGDWARYGAEIKALGQVLERLKAVQATKP